MGNLTVVNLVKYIVFLCLPCLSFDNFGKMVWSI